MIILVTGAPVGFGAAIARRFAAEGARVVATGRRRERLDELAAEFGPEIIHPLVLDVRDRAAVEAAIANLPADFADIDLLVNNGGLALGLTPAQQADSDRIAHFGLVLLGRSFGKDAVSRK
jgi:3-hydroxy acid dehydrogenase / malonic semialdehyde reductase